MCNITDYVDAWKSLIHGLIKAEYSRYGTFYVFHKKC